MDNKRNDAKVRLHFNTAGYLFKSLTESMAVDPEEYKYQQYTYYSYRPEDSDESIIRRCVQIRQELLQVMKGLRK